MQYQLSDFEHFQMEMHLQRKMVIVTKIRSSDSNSKLSAERVNKLLLLSFCEPGKLHLPTPISESTAPVRLCSSRLGTSRKKCCCSPYCFELCFISLLYSCILFLCVLCSYLCEASKDIVLSPT